MNLQDYLETDFIPVNENDTLADLIHAIENSKRNIFPVVNKENKLVGEILLDNVCLLYTSPSPRDRTRSRMPSSA